MVQQLSDEARHQREEMKHRMEATWHAAAEAYSECVIEHHLLRGLYPTFQSLLVPLLRDVDGARILDLASASGEPAATLAAALPQASVLSTDFCPDFLALAQARVQRLGLPNLAAETADAEDLHRYGGASFDAVTCSLGLMFMPSFDVALEEVARVLKPGGTFAAAVWQAEERVPFFATTRQLAAEYDAESAPQAASATAVRFGDPQAELLPAVAAAGLAEVECRELQLEFVMPAHLWWEELLKMPLPLKPALTKAQERRPGEDVFGEARQRLQQTLQGNGWLRDDGSLHITSNGCWFITACKPAAQ